MEPAYSLVATPLKGAAVAISAADLKAVVPSLYANAAEVSAALTAAGLAGSGGDILVEFGKLVAALPDEVSGYRALLSGINDRAQALDDLDAIEFLELENDVEIVRFAVERLKPDGGGGLVNCLNQCDSDYEKCKKSNSTFLCGLDALSCVTKCGKDALPL